MISGITFFLFLLHSLFVIGYSEKYGCSSALKDSISVEILNEGTFIHFKKKPSYPPLSGKKAIFINPF